jgi:hypothetical protein
MSEPILTDAEYREKLTPEQYHVARQGLHRHLLGRARRRRLPLHLL